MTTQVPDWPEVPDDELVSAPVSEAEALVRRVSDVLQGAKTMPLSASVKLDNRDELVDLLGEALARFPDELRAARWMLKEREAYLAKTRREADAILDAARVQAERMVARTEVVRSAEARAASLLEQASDEARRLRLEAEDYCDQKLATFELVLERTLKTVAAGREKLNSTGLAQPRPPEPEDDEAGNAFFDQDLG